jgi:hypothetical protein
LLALASVLLPAPKPAPETKPETKRESDPVYESNPKSVLAPDLAPKPNTTLESDTKSEFDPNPMRLLEFAPVSTPEVMP